jgi:Tfp pilus assembly protein PilN
VSLVNLLPPELRERQAVRRTTSLVVAVGLAALALIGILYLFQVLRLSQVRSDLEAQRSTNARLVSQIASLREFAALQAELAAKEALIDVIFVNEVSWSSALLDVSRVIPDASYLTNLTGQIQATVAGEVVAEPKGGTPRPPWSGT